LTPVLTALSPVNGDRSERGEHTRELFEHLPAIPTGARHSVMLLLVRHGETLPNRHGLLLGRSDPPLTEAGEAYAHELAVALPSPDRVVASPLRRARDTAAAFGRSVEIDERWIELDYGDLDGRDPTSVADHVWAHWRADSSFSPPGGESLETLSSRVAAACAELSQEAVGSTVVVVTHVSPIKAALAWALDVPVGIAWRMYVEEASVSRIDIGADGPVVRWFNRGNTREH
jgi:broad specificity phosphatase PhoE